MTAATFALGRLLQDKNILPVYTYTIKTFPALSLRPFQFYFLTARAQQTALLSQLRQVPENEKVRLYVKLSEAYAQRQPDSAVHYANEGLRLAEKRDNRQGQASLLLALGENNALHHHAELARGFFNEALGLYRLLHDVAGVAGQQKAAR